MFAPLRNGIAFMTCRHYGGSLVWRDVEMQHWHVWTAREPYDNPAGVTIGDGGIAPNLGGSSTANVEKGTRRLRGNGDG